MGKGQGHHPMTFKVWVGGFNNLEKNIHVQETHFGLINRRL
jgi:hypothetical protein